METEYNCANCGKDLSPNEKPCSSCGSDKRKIGVTLTEKIEFKDKVKELENISESYSGIFEPLAKKLSIAYFLMVLVLLACIFPYALNYESLNHERTIFASIGILTFIAIFYSLRVTEEGKKILNDIKGIRKFKEDELKSDIKEIFKEGKELDEIIDGINIIKKSQSKINRVRYLADIDYFQRIAVASLMMSIILSIFDNRAYINVAYVLFSLGISFSFLIVIVWEISSKFSNKQYTK